MMYSVSASCELINIPKLEGLDIDQNPTTFLPETIRCNFGDVVLVDYHDNCFVVEDLETGETVKFTFGSLHSSSYKYDIDFERAFRNAFTNKSFILATEAALEQREEMIRFKRISF